MKQVFGVNWELVIKGQQFEWDPGKTGVGNPAKDSDSTEDSA